MLRWILGLGYNSRKPDGTILWNGGANVRLRLFESCTTYGQVSSNFHNSLDKVKQTTNSTNTFGTNRFMTSYFYL